MVLQGGKLWLRGEDTDTYSCVCVLYRHGGVISSALSCGQKSSVVTPVRNRSHGGKRSQASGPRVSADGTVSSILAAFKCVRLLGVQNRGALWPCVVCPAFFPGPNKHLSDRRLHLCNRLDLPHPFPQEKFQNRLFCCRSKGRVTSCLGSSVTWL